MDTSPRCPEISQLQAFVRGKLPEGEAQDVARHLTQCGNCLTVMRGLPWNDGETKRVVKPAHHQPTAVFLESNAASEPPQAATQAINPVPTERHPIVAGGIATPLLSPAVAADEIGRLGNYRVLRELGRGGMGIVYHAEDTTLGRPVALKVMKPDLKADFQPWQRFLQEARGLAKVKNEHVVTVFQVGQEGSVVYLALEYLEGQSLDQWMNNNPGPACSEIVRIGREIAKGLAAIHRHGLIHRDVKPENIWLEAPEGKVKILDFGLARSVHDDSRFTSTGLVVGTPAFMSPEQARSEKLDARSDLFSLGCVLYLMCTGAEPFRGTTPMAQLTALAVDDPHPIHRLNPALPAALSELVMSLLAKRPEQRPASALEVVQRLDQIAAASPSPSRQDAGRSAPSLRRDRSDTVRLSPAQGSGRRRWKVALGLVLLAVVLLLGIVIGRPRLFSSGAAKSDGDYLSEMVPFAAVDWPMRPPPEGGPGGPPPEGGPGRPPFPPGEPPDRPPPPPPGEHGKDHLPPPPGGGLGGDFFARMSVQGKRSPHGIGMHASPQGEASISYQLDQRYATFSAQVSLNDSSPQSPIPLVFCVYGDNELLWKSKPISNQTDGQDCNVSVEGIKVLKLSVQSSGDVRGAHGAWIEPRVVKRQ